MKKVLEIFSSGFEETEGIAPMDILVRCGAKVVKAAIDDVEAAHIKINNSFYVESSHGILMQCDCLLSSVADDDFDAVVLPGGLKGANNLKSSSLVGKILKKMDKQEKIISAICASPALVLRSHGIFVNGDKRKGICFPGMEGVNDDGSGCISFNNVTQKGVCVSKNIITSYGMGTSIYFGLAIAEKLFGKDVAEDIRKKVVVI